MDGGAATPEYGSWQNWLVALFTPAGVTILSHFGRGTLKLSSILVGITAGYLLSIPFGMTDFSAVRTAGLFQPPAPLYFPITFEPSSCAAIAILFAVNSVQAIGDFSAVTVGSMDREPELKELKGGITGYGLSNILGDLLGGLPTATYSQNVGIATATKVINRFVLGLAALILPSAGLIPKVSALLTTIPQCVLGALPSLPLLPSQ